MIAIIGTIEFSEQGAHVQSICMTIDCSDQVKIVQACESIIESMPELSYVIPAIYKNKIWQ